MRKTALFCIAFSILSICVHSQKNLKPGKIVLNNNDTIRGFIDYREWSRNPSHVNFTTSTAEKTKSYDKNDITYFEITGHESYRKYFVSISQDANRINDISEKDTATVNDEAFLKELYSGKNVKLFSYGDQIKLRYYILVKNETRPIELKNSIYKVEGKIVSENEYRLQLASIASLLLPGSTTILNSIDNAAYSPKNLLAIMYRLDGIMDAGRTRKNQESPVRLFFGVGASMGSSSFSGDIDYSGQKSSFVSPLLNLGIDVLANPGIRKFYLHNSLSYSSYKTEAKFHKEYYEVIEDYLYQLRQHNLILNIQPVLNWFNQPDLQFFTGVGAIANFAFNKANNQIIYKQYLDGRTATYNKEDFLFLKKFWLNFNVRAGVTIKNLCLDFNYLPKAGISDAQFYSLKSSTMQLELIYLFQKTRSKKTR